LKRFTKKSEERPSSSDSTGSILRGDDWCRIRRLLKRVVDDIGDQRVQKLSDCLIRFSAENSLLKSRCEGLEKALVNEKKETHARALEIRDPNDGNVIFFSPNKVQRAREIQADNMPSLVAAASGKVRARARRRFNVYKGARRPLDLSIHNSFLALKIPFATMSHFVPGHFVDPSFCKI